MSVSVTLSALASQLVFVRLSVSLSVVNQSISQSFNPSVGLKYANIDGRNHKIQGCYCTGPAFWASAPKGDEVL